MSSAIRVLCVCFGEPATFPHILNENWSKLWFLVVVYIYTFSIHLAIRRTPKPLIYWYQCCCWFSRSDQAGRSRTLACGACVVCWFYSSFVFSSLLCLLYLIQITYYLNKNSDTHPSRTTHILCVSKIFITKCDNFCCDVWIMNMRPRLAAHDNNFDPKCKILSQFAVVSCWFIVFPG